MPDGLPVQIVFGDLEWAEFDLISADGHTMLRCFREPGLPDGQIRKHLFEDEQLQAAYLGAFGQPLQPNAVEVQDHVTIHGGDPASVKFCHHVGMNYVSCSPYRVPIARLAAAQAVVEQE